MMLVILIVILVLYLAIKGNSLKGKAGEKVVANILEQIPGNKKIINDIMINDNGKSRQIDHIFINKNGIFVIETKNYAGNIYGKETSNEWSQYLNEKRFDFKNPIFQNYAHKQIVSKVVETEDNIIPVIVFTRRCNLKVQTVKNAVLYTSQLQSFILNQNVKLKDSEIDEYYNKIMENRITNEETIRNHNFNVQHYVAYKNNLTSNNICPRCSSGKLIVRQGKYGKFLGCSNYPKCKYTKKL